MAKRRRAATRGRRSRRSGSPLWLWALAGLLIGLIVGIVLWLRPAREGAPARPAPATHKAAPPPAARKPHPARPATGADDDAARARYQFYDLLPKQKLALPPAEEPEAQVPLLAKPKTRKARPGTWFLQAGSFRARREAERRKAELALLGIESAIERVRVNDGEFHRVRIGPFTDHDAAVRVQTRLQSQRIPSLLVKVRE